MQHSFFQKLILVALAGAMTAGVYVYVYKGIIVGADEAVNGGYKKPAAHVEATPKRRY